MYQGLCIAGAFTSASSPFRNRVAIYNGVTFRWDSLGTGMNDVVTSLASDSAYLYAGGYFETAGGSSANKIARWDGNAWYPLGSGVDGAPSYVQVLAVSGSGLYVGGNFTSVGGKSSHYIARWGGPPSVATLSVPLRSGWNLVSNPVIAANDSVRVLFPGATSSAFFYNSSGYHPQAIMSVGSGYWIDFPSAGSVTLSGSPVLTYTIPVTQGWNLIGSISQPVATSSIGSIPPGMTTSSFYGYSGSYTTSALIEPGSAYWVKVNENGSLILSSGPSNPAGAIHIVPTSELPPSPPQVTGLDQIVRVEMFTLEQNYPDPFNPTTTIRYQLPAASHVTLKIYNTLGQEVATLVNGPQESGYNSAVWSARNVASGLYFYRITATSGQNVFIDVKRMLVLK